MRIYPKGACHVEIYHYVPTRLSSHCGGLACEKSSSFKTTAEKQIDQSKLGKS